MTQDLRGSLAKMDNEIFESIKRGLQEAIVYKNGEFDCTSYTFVIEKETANDN